MTQRNHILSVDIGGSTCKIGHVSVEGDVFDVQRFPTEELKDGGPEWLIEQLQPYVNDHSISGIALGIPATVDWDHNHVRSHCSEVPWFEDSSNKKTLQDELGRPILLVNDVEALLVGEWNWGELKGLDSGVVLSLGTSMGSALLWNSQPQQGRRGSIMELEHISLNTFGEIEDEDPPGCASRWLSGRGLQARMAEIGESVALEQFFATDDEQLVELRQKFEDKLAHLLGLIVMMLDPERVVLAGGLTGSYKEWFPAVKDKMNRFVLEQFSGIPSVNLGRLRGDEVIKGPAAFWDWKQQE